MIILLTNNGFPGGSDGLDISHLFIREKGLEDLSPGKRSIRLSFGSEHN